MNLVERNANGPNADNLIQLRTLFTSSTGLEMFGTHLAACPAPISPSGIRLESGTPHISCALGMRYPTSARRRLDDPIDEHSADAGRSSMPLNWDAVFLVIGGDGRRGHRLRQPERPSDRGGG